MSNEHVDLETLETLKEVMEDDFQLLIETYLVDADSRIQKLQSEGGSLSSEDLRKEAHSLKGSSSNIGAPQLSQLCFTLEEKGRKGQLEGVDVDIQAVVAEFETVKGILTAL